MKKNKQLKVTDLRVGDKVREKKTGFEYIVEKILCVPGEPTKAIIYTRLEDDNGGVWRFGLEKLEMVEERCKRMKTNWTNWGADAGEVTAEYTAQGKYDNSDFEFYASIRFLRNGTFEVAVEDCRLFSVEEDGEDKVFNTFEEAFTHLAEIDCEKYFAEFLEGEERYQKRMEEEQNYELV